MITSLEKGVLMTPEQERLVTENMKLAYHIANQFQNTGIDEDDLESAATFGLLKAAQTFNTSKGFKFSTYAGQCIQNEIRMILRNNRKHRQVVFLDDSIYANDEGDKLTYIDCIEDSNSDFITPILQHEDFERMINVTFNRLQGTRRIITLYFFASKKQRWIADTLGMSQSYVSRLITKCCEEIKKAMKRNECKGIFSFHSSALFYSISFLKQDVPFFDEAYQNLKKKETDDITSVFQMQQDKNRIILSVPSDLANFFYFARLLQELDQFQFHDKKTLESPTKKATSIKSVQRKPM